MNEEIEYQANGFLFGQTFAEAALGTGALTRQEINAKYRDLYEKIVNGEITLVNTDAEWVQQLSGGGKLTDESENNIASLASRLRKTQRDIVQHVLQIIRADENSQM